MEFILKGQTVMGCEKDAYGVRGLGKGRRKGGEQWNEEINELIQHTKKPYGHLLQSRLEDM